MDNNIVSVAASYQVALRRINISLPLKLVEELLDLMGQMKDTAKVRQTEDGRYSILDFIANVVEKRSSAENWKRLLNTHPDTITFCDSVNLPRTDGKKSNLKSPVTTELGLLMIAYLLPGELGNRIRKANAQLAVETLVGYRQNLNLLFAKTDLADEIKFQLKTALTAFPNTLDKVWKTSGIINKSQVKKAILRDFVEERDYVWADGILCVNDSTFHILIVSFLSLAGADIESLPEVIHIKTREYFQYQAAKKMNGRIAQNSEWEQPLLPLVY